MDSRTQRHWGNFLNPDVLRGRLIAASLFVAAFEALKDSIVGRIRDFYCFGFNEKGYMIDPEYKQKVLSRNRSPVYASLSWLKEVDAIDDADVEAFGRVKKCRNQIAHGLLGLVGSEGLPPDFEVRLQELSALFRKIEVWWIREVEIPTNPDFDGKEVDVSTIIPGPLMALQILCDVALGSEEQSRVYYDEFKRKLDERGV